MATDIKLTVAKVPGSADMMANNSKIKIELTVTTSGESWNADGDTVGAISVDGKETVSLNGKKFYKNSTTTLYSGTKTVQHEEDGTKTVTVKATFDTKISAGVLTEEQTLELDSIPRSSMTVPVFTMGEAGEIIITPIGSGMRHEILYVFGSKTGTAVAKTDKTKVQWTPPRDLAWEIPRKATGTGKLTLKSYKGDTVGSREYDFTVKTPGDIGPTISGVSITVDNSELKVDWGVALQGKSKLQFSAEASAQYGATVKKAQFQFGTQKKDAISGSIVPKSSGTFTPKWTVEDSRGMVVGLAMRPVNVVAYSDPVLTNPEVFRSDKNGNEDESGAYLTARGGVDYSAVNGKNTGQLRMRRREVGGAWGSYTELKIGENNILAIAENKSYEVELLATDAMGESKPVVYTVPTAAAAFVLGDGGESAGFGKYPERNGLDIGWDIHMNGHRITGLGKPEDPTDAVPWGELGNLSCPIDKIYPVGSIYLSVADIDPATVFGGTWERIKDVFLLAAGDSYAAGAIGGEATHKLTTAEMPAHQHYANSSTANSATNGWDIMRSNGLSQQGTSRSSVSSAGGGEAHNNMPPYLAVNVWKRTA